MTVKFVAYSTLVLRILTLPVLAASATYMVLNSYKLIGHKITWKDLETYTVICIAYMLIQIPFSLYYTCTEKRLIRHLCLPEFDFYRDKLISYILATGVNACFVASMKLREMVDDFVALIAFILVATNENIDLGFDLDKFRSGTHKFLDREIIATILLTIRFAFMVVTSILSFVNCT